MKWWKPIETGGLYSCLECPHSIHKRPEVSDLEGTVRALEDEVDTWKKLWSMSETQNRKLLEVADQLIANLSHSTLCDVRWGDKPCSCGVAEKRTMYLEALNG
jgi:hypothetical protein